MSCLFPTALFSVHPLAAAWLSPAVILVLCVAGGIGTILLLPGRRETPIRNIGGVVLAAVGLIFVALLVHYAAASADASRGGMGAFFWIFSTIAIVAAVRVITHPRPVYSALYFVLTVMASAGLFILVGAEFMAAALVLIYAGAILVTYVFVIMLAAQTVPSDKAMAGIVEYDAVSREPVLASAVGFTLAGVLMFLIFDKAPVANAGRPSLQPSPSVLGEGVSGGVAVEGGGGGSTAALGSYLFENQVVSLELAGVILTMAMVGAIVIARRRVVSGVVTEGEPVEQVTAAATPVDDNPHSIPVYGTDNPRAKAYPER